MTDRQPQENKTGSLETIVLAGGNSLRMGEDKALLELDGVPLLRRICDIAATCTQKVHVVTPWGDRYSYLNLPANTIAEPRGRQIAPGPLTGFACGLQVVQSEWVLLLACDLPGLTLEGLQQGIACLEHVPSNSTTLLHHHPKGWEPLCGFYRRHCLASVQEAIASGKRSFQAWLSTQEIAVWNDADPRLFINCNTPEEWSRVSQEQ